MSEKIYLPNWHSKRLHLKALRRELNQISVKVRQLIGDCKPIPIELEDRRIAIADEIMKMIEEIEEKP